MNLDQVASLTLNNVQMLLEQNGIPLAVGPISDRDFQALSTAYAELQWDYAFTTYGNREDKFEFCVKLIEDNNPLPAGAAMCIYNIDDGTFDIHFVESFVRNIPSHPLHGRMILITMWAAYLFCMAVDCQRINVIEPINTEVMALYAKLGFSGDLNYMSASTEDIKAAVLGFA
ncbi:Uncharacterised protein [Yersinia frederiksenii]|nr:Uncharacterised protein [Yersinia frederiksenii]